MAKRRPATLPISSAPPPDVPAHYLSEETALALLPIALAKGLGKAESPSPGQYQLRGVAMIAVDCWIDQKAGYDAAPSFPASDVLAIALGLAVTEPEQLESLLKRAAKKVLACGDGKIDKGQVGFALERVKEQVKETQTKEAKTGSCGVKGDVRIVSFTSRQAA